jgi:predicted dehydrogenase
MVQAAAYYPSLVAVVGHGLRALPAAVEMKRLLQDGYVGQTISHCDVRLSTPRYICFIIFAYGPQRS